MALINGTPGDDILVELHQWRRFVINGLPGNDSVRAADAGNGKKSTAVR